MFGGFDPGERNNEFFENRRGQAIGLSIFAYLLCVGLYFGIQALTPPKEEVVEEEVIDVLLAPEPEEDKPEEPEEEPEPEEPEPEEPPPPTAPPPPPGVTPPPPSDEVPPVEDAPPVDVSDKEIGKDAPVGPQGSGYGTGEPGGKGDGTGDGEGDKPEGTPTEEKKPPPKVVASDVLTPNDTPAKPDPSNPSPEYPPPMQKRGIEGKVAVKYTVHQSGKLTKVAFTTVSNTATKPEEIEKANEAMKKAVQKAMAQWKFLEPCKRDGKKAFTCTMKKTFPFKLKK